MSIVSEQPQIELLALSAAEIPATSATITIVEPSSIWSVAELVEVWRYRDLLYMLALRDIKVRYKQTFVGALWALLQPLLTMLIFYALFGLIGRRPVCAGVPYALSAYAGLLVWQLFASSLTQAARSLVDNQALIKKVYCPRLVFPLAPVLVALVDFAVAAGLLVPLAFIFGWLPSWHLLLSPLFILLAILTALALGIWLAALAAIYRDFIYVIPFLTQIWLYLTPVLYDTQSVVPAKWRSLYFLNPMAGIVEGFRFSLFGHGELSPVYLAISLATAAATLLGGLAYFRHADETLADVV